MRGLHPAFGQLLLRDIVQRQQQNLPLILAQIDTPPMQRQDLVPNAMKIALHLEIFEEFVLGESPPQIFPQLGSIPLGIGNLVEESAFRTLPMEVKRVEERAVADDH